MSFYLEYSLIVLAIIVPLTLILNKILVEKMIVIIFLFQSLTYASVAIFESVITPLNDGWQIYAFGLWGLTFTLVDLSYIAFYVFNFRQVYRRISKMRIFMIGFFVFGLDYLVGIAFADFGYFIIFGLDRFKPQFATWFNGYGWINGVFPVFYLAIFAGLVLVLFSLAWFIKNKPKKFKLPRSYRIKGLVVEKRK